MESYDFTELIPGLPEELGLECITRLPYKTHPVASSVCRLWRQLIKSPEFYQHRKKSGLTRVLACLVQALPLSHHHSSTELKSNMLPSYGVTIFDPQNQSWERIDPIPQYPDGLPLFCQIASCDGNLVVMGGWNPATFDPIIDVFVYDFTTCEWRKGKEMPCKRSFFAIGASDGRVYIAGGHDENKNAMKSAWVYDLRKDEWSELSQMNQERDECEGVIIGGEFWVVSGYGTEKQGMFEGSAEVYELGSETSEWKIVDQAWESGRCPRSCVGMVKNGKLTNWSELDPAVRVGGCGVELGSQILVTGSEYQGSAQNFYSAEGQNGKMKRISVPEEYSGIVQSACCVEV